MADYADLDRINQLYLQSKQVAQAIDNIDGGGPLLSVVIGPPPPPPPPEGGMPSPMMMGMVVNIAIPQPAAPATITGVRAQLVVMETDIATQLQALGVTATPPARSSL
jgi:hypothetical protein